MSKKRFGFLVGAGLTVCMLVLGAYTPSQAIPSFQVIAALSCSEVFGSLKECNGSGGASDPWDEYPGPDTMKLHLGGTASLVGGDPKTVTGSHGNWFLRCNQGQTITMYAEHEESGQVSSTKTYTCPAS